MTQAPPRPTDLPGPPPGAAPGPPIAAVPPTPWDQGGGRSRVTALIRLAAAGWLIWRAISILAEVDPSALAARHGVPADRLLPFAGLSFALGCFLLSGFMSRVAGGLLVGLSAWEATTIGAGLAPVALGLVGAYLLLRGGGAWGMDVYVQKMQDRVRRREAMQRLARSRDEER